MRSTLIQTITSGIGINDGNTNDGGYPPLISNTQNTGSQIVEPEIITPILSNINTSNSSIASANNEIIQSLADSQAEILQSQASQQAPVVVDNTVINPIISPKPNTPVATDNQLGLPNPNAVPSATTDQTKVYVGGGTSPNSNIIVTKPKPNYLLMGLSGIILVLVCYKLFFNKKSE